MDRLDQLAVLLKSDRRLTVSVLAQEMQVSVRTISRDIGILREKGYPIEADRGRGGGVQLHRFWGVGRVKLNVSEAIDLLISIAVAEKMNSPLFLGNLGPVRDKVTASFSSDMKAKLKSLRSRVLVGFPASANILSGFEPTMETHTSRVHQAFTELRLLSMTYVSTEGTLTKRTVEPQFLYLHYPVWYLLAWDLLRNDVRNFRIDRIRSCRIEDQAFELRDQVRFSEQIKTFATPV